MGAGAWLGRRRRSKSDWSPANEASAHEAIDYAKRQGFGATYSGNLGYPLLNLAQQIQIFRPSMGRSGSANSDREALYSDDRRANLTDICLYPGGPGFIFTSGMCAAFKANMRNALGDGYSTMKSALRSAYLKTQGLPKGVSDFNAIIHHQLARYDDFGNLVHAISPLSPKQGMDRAPLCL